MGMYFALLAGLALARVVPYRWLYAVAGGVGDLAWHVSPTRRVAVMANLRHVVGPSVGQARLAALSRQVFRHAARNYLDVLTVGAQSVAQIEARIEGVQGMDRFEAVIAAGKGTIIVAPHMGNMELLVQYLGLRHIPITIPVEHTQPERLFRLLKRLRETHGVRLIPLASGDDGASGGATAGELLALLRRGEVLGLVADRNLAGTGIAAPFFGRRAILPLGPALLALRAGAPLIGVHAERLPGGRTRGHVTRIVHVARRGRLQESLEAATGEVAALLEDAIREHPEQWTVLAPIWHSDAAALDETPSIVVWPAGSGQEAAGGRRVEGGRP